MWFYVNNSHNDSRIIIEQNAIFANNSSVYGFYKPNSKFGSIQIGAITYSFRSMSNDNDQLFKFCIDDKISVIEVMGDPAETFAGKPISPIKMAVIPLKEVQPQRAHWTEEQKARIIS